MNDIAPIPPNEPLISRVCRLEQEIAQHPQVDCPVRHYFAPGLYAREMTIPKGVVAVGAVHKTEHLTVISAGRVLITADDVAQEFTAPYTFVSKPGTKRAAYAMEETVITTFHVTETTDLDALVEELTESTAQQLLGGTENKQLLNHGRIELCHSELSPVLDLPLSAPQQQIVQANARRKRNKGRRTQRQRKPR